MTAPEPPPVWWSPSLAAQGRIGLVIQSDITPEPQPALKDGELPADAVRLVREEDVDDLRLRLWQEQDAARAAGIPRGTIVAAQSVVGNILMNAPESMSLQEIAVAVVDEVAGALAVLPGDAGAVPDPGQAREQILQRDITFGEYVIAVCDAIGLPHNSPRAAVVEAIRAAVAAAQAPESPTDSTPKAGRGGSGETETATDTVQAPGVAARCSCTATHCLVSCVICGRVSYDGGCPNEAVSDREAVLERERLVQQKVLEQYERKIETLQAHAVELGRTLDRTAVALSESQSALRKATKAAQSGDTDRLAWISEAGETAAVERHVRYQETACALRPDAVTGFVERLAMEWEQRAADVKPAIHATEQDVYGECAARLRGLLAQRDLAAGSWQPFTPTAVTVPTARLTEWAGLLRQLSVHVPLEGPARDQALEAAQLMQWWARGDNAEETPDV